MAKAEACGHGVEMELDMVESTGEMGTLNRDGLQLKQLVLFHSSHTSQHQQKQKKRLEQRLNTDKRKLLKGSLI